MIKSACTRASLIPYPVIAAAVGGNPEAVNRVVRHDVLLDAQQAQALQEYNIAVNVIPDYYYKELEG